MNGAGADHVGGFLVALEHAHAHSGGDRCAEGGGLAGCLVHLGLDAVDGGQHIGPQAAARAAAGEHHTADRCTAFLHDLGAGVQRISDAFIYRAGDMALVVIEGEAHQHAFGVGVPVGSAPAHEGGQEHYAFCAGLYLAGHVLHAGDAVETLVAGEQVLDRPVECRRTALHGAADVVGLAVHIEIVEDAALLVANGLYYLICLNEETKETEGIRIDHIEEIVITTEAGTPLQETEFRNTTLDGYMRMHPFLFAGKTVKASLKIPDDALGKLSDTFGNNITISFAESGFFRISLRCNEEDLFRWALLHSDMAEILTPQYLRNRLRTETEKLWERYCTTNEDQVDTIIKNAVDRNGVLIIQSRNLTGQMEQIPPNTLHYVDLRSNTGCSMSFLKEQSELVSLTVFNQPFDQPELLLGANKLETVRFINTGIKDISVLGKISTLQTVMLSERDADNIPGIENLKGKKVILSRQFAMKLDIKALKNAGIDISIQSLGKMIGVTRELMRKP